MFDIEQCRYQRLSSKARTHGEVWPPDETSFLLLATYQRSLPVDPSLDAVNRQVDSEGSDRIDQALTM